MCIEVKAQRTPPKCYDMEDPEIAFTIDSGDVDADVNAAQK